MMQKFFQLSSKSPNPETPDKAWIAEAMHALVCSECSSVRVVGKPVNVVLQTKPDRSAYNFVHGICIHIGTISLLDTLFPRGPEKFLLLGNVYGPERVEVTEFRTIRAKHCILVRGDEQSSFRRCPECGRILYSAIGKRYILKRDIGSADVYETQSGNIVVTEEIAERVINGTWRNLVVRALGIRDDPVDGLTIS